MKLSLDTSNLNKPKPEHLPAPDEYASPIRWWTVTTEGDVEGRTTTNLGVYYGHIAEIAFALADKAFYSLCFHPTAGSAPKERSKYSATKTSVWVSLDVKSNTWNMDKSYLESWFAKWMHITAPKVRVRGQLSNCNYFASVNLSLE